MSKQLVIPCTKMILVLDEKQLLRGLSPETIVIGIKQGKGYKRAQVTSRRCTEGFDRWQLYEILKGNREVDDLALQAIEAMPIVEIREAVTEYILSRKRAG